MKKFKISTNITNRSNSGIALQSYFNEVNAIPVFSDSEEKECLIKISSGDFKSKDELIKRNLRFVISIANSYITNQVNIEDLINEGNEGLIIAANRFNPDSGYKFITYAVFWIKRNIMNYINNNSDAIRMPANKYTDLFKLKKMLASKSQELGREASIDDLIDEVIFNDIKDIDILSRIKTINFDSLNIDDDTLFVDTLISDTFKPADELIEDGVLNSILFKYINKLSNKEQIILTHIYGLNNNKKLSTLDIAKLKNINMSRQGVQNIHLKSLIKLKKLMKTLDT